MENSTTEATLSATAEEVAQLLVIGHRAFADAIEAALNSTSRQTGSMIMEEIRVLSDLSDLSNLEPNLPALKPDSKWLTREEAAKRLSVGVKSISSWTKREVIEAEPNHVNFIYHVDTLRIFEGVYPCSSPTSHTSGVGYNYTSSGRGFAAKTSLPQQHSILYEVVRWEHEKQLLRSDMIHATLVNRGLLSPSIGVREVSYVLRQWHFWRPRHGYWALPKPPEEDADPIAVMKWCRFVAFLFTGVNFPVGRSLPRNITEASNRLKLMGKQLPLNSEGGLMWSEFNA